MARFRSDKHRRAVMAALNNGNRRSSNNKVGLSQVRSKKRTPGKSLDVTPYLQRITQGNMKRDPLQEGIPQSERMDYVHKRTTRPMLSRVGGKSKIAREISEKIPEHDTYVEPFVGGGVCVF